MKKEEFEVLITGGVELGDGYVQLPIGKYNITVRNGWKHRVAVKITVDDKLKAEGLLVVQTQLCAIDPGKFYYPGQISKLQVTISYGKQPPAPVARESTGLPDMMPQIRNPQMEPYITDESKPPVVFDFNLVPITTLLPVI